MWFHLGEVPGVFKFMERESRRVSAGAGGSIEIGSDCLMGMKLQFGNMKRFLRWTLVMVEH